MKINSTDCVIIIAVIITLAVSAVFFVNGSGGVSAELSPYHQGLNGQSVNSNWSEAELACYFEAKRMLGNGTRFVLVENAMWRKTKNSADPNMGPRMAAKAYRDGSY